MSDSDSPLDDAERVGAPRKQHDTILSVLKGPSGEQILAITCVIAATQLVWGILVPILPAFAQSMGIDAGRIGILVAGFGLGRIVANIPAGFLGRRVNRSALFLTGAFGVVIFSALGGFATSFVWLLVVRVLTGIMGGVAITSGQSLLADAVNPWHRARAMSLLQGLQLAGGSVGPALGGFAAAAFGLRAPFFVSGIVCLGFVLWIVLHAPLRRSLAAVRPVEHGIAAAEGGSRSLSFIAACVVGFAVFFSRFGIQQTLLPLIAYQVAGFSTAGLGMVYSAMAILNIVCAIFLGGLSDRVGRKRVIVSSLIAVALVTCAFVLPSNVWTFLALALVFGLASSIGGPVPAAYVAELVDGARRGPAIGIYRTFGDLAGIVGPIVIGYAISWLGFLPAVFVSAGIVAAAAVFFACFAVETVPGIGRRRGEPEG